MSPLSRISTHDVYIMINALHVLSIKHISCRNDRCIIVREGRFLDLKQCNVKICTTVSKSRTLDNISQPSGALKGTLQLSHNTIFTTYPQTNICMFLCTGFCFEANSLLRGAAEAPTSKRHLSCRC